MPDDIRQLLRDATLDHESASDFDGLWSRARRRRWQSRTGGAAAVVVVLAGTVMGLDELLAPTPTLEVASTPNACPVTVPDGDFVPPAPYLEQPSSDRDAWFGTSELWTVLDVGGAYQPRKSVWWSEDFEGGSHEPRPEITVTWERLDEPEAPTVTVDQGTNAHTFANGWFMIAGIDPDEAGCWQVTAGYRDAELSYVYLVE